MSATRTFPAIRHEIAGLPIADLAKNFGTPTFIYDASLIEQRVANLQAFDVVRFAQKACSNLAIVDLVRRCGAMIDAVSAGEIRRALAAGYVAGGEPPRIVYTADIFDREALDLVVEHNIHVNCGSPDMIDQLGERLPGSEVTLRLNPGFGHGHSQKTNTGGEQSKHGIWHTQLGDCLRKIDQHGMSVTGIHMHIGSGTDMEHLSQVCGALETAAFETGRSVKSISAGGGLPTPYREGDESIDIGAYFDLWDASRKRLAAAFEHEVSLEIEPGRYLTAEAGYLLAEIRAIKRMGSKDYYLIDAGFNNLARPILYGAYHPMSLAPGNTDTERELIPIVVGGPLCESGDIFTQEEGGFVESRPLPAAKVGEWLIIECAGAYGSVMGSNYNSKPLAAEVMIRDGVAHLIRARQTFDDMVRGEQIPAP